MIKNGVIIKQCLYYQFPFGRIPQNTNVVLWGYGVIGKQYLNQIRSTGYCNVRYIVDQGWKNILIDGIEVSDPERIKEDNDSFIIVSTSKGVDEIRKQLQEWGKDERIVFAESSLLLPAWDREKVEISEDDQLYYAQLKELLTPRSIKNVELIRTGRDYDGGYLMADDFKRGRVAYSFGIADDISWDLDISSKGYDVYMYDHTIDGIKNGNNRTHFFKRGLAGGKTQVSELAGLNELLSSNGHVAENNMILKIDIEGAEWDFLENIDVSILRQFDQIVFELHQFITSDNKQRIIDCLKKLNGTHQAIHVHANNMSSHLLKMEDGIIPECIEVTYARKDIYSFEDVTIGTYNDLDQPNLKGVAQIVYPF